jgi:hypothetical protein
MMKKEYLWPLIISIITLLLGQGIFAKLYYSPKLVYEILPIHMIDDQETFSVVMKNPGRVLLHNVVISIKSERPIYKMRLEGPEIMDSSGNDYIVSGKIGDSAVKMRIDRLVRESKYTLTLLTKKDSKVDITIVSDETDAKREVIRTGMGLFDYIAPFVSAFLAGVTAFMLFSLSKVKVLKKRIDALVDVEHCLGERRKSGTRMKEFLEIISEALSKVISILDSAEKDYKDDPGKLVTSMEAAKEIILGINERLKSFSEVILVEGVCFDVKKDGK